MFLESKKRLFIIGNGFDLHHGLATRYLDFISFLNENDRSAYDLLYESISRYSLTHWNVLTDDINDAEWNELEAILGSFEPMELLEETVDRTLPLDYSGAPTQRLQDMLMFGLKVSDYLTSWLTPIELQLKGLVPKQKIRELLGDDAIILNFNYTSTLQKLYDARDVLHIHGSIGKKLVMGHDAKDEGKDIQIASDHNIDFINQKFLRQYFIKTSKGASTTVKRRKKFFSSEKFKNINEIYVLGHSLNPIDMPYIDAIMKLHSGLSQVEWKIAYYGKESREKYKAVLSEMGISKEKITFIPWQDLN